MRPLKTFPILTTEIQGVGPSQRISSVSSQTGTGFFIPHIGFGQSLLKYHGMTENRRGPGPAVKLKEMEHSFYS